MTKDQPAIMKRMMYLLRSYNPDLPMGAGMRAQFLELREQYEREEREGITVVTKSPDANVEKNRRMVKNMRHSTECLKCAGGTNNTNGPCRCAVEAASKSPDSNVEKNRELLLQRSLVGLAKYGVTTERTDLTRAEWVQHAIEETLDLANYLQALKTNLEVSP